jgi:hypothetical protein
MVGSDAGPLRARSRLKIADATPALRERPAALTLLTAILFIAAGLLWHLTRGALFIADDWTWITTRRAHTFSTFADPYNGHLSLIPVAVYQVMFHFFGLVHYWGYRALIICGDLACALLIYAYTRLRVGELRAVMLTAMILFLGPGWDDILWSFQIAWLISLGAGIGALIALDRRDRVGDVVACLLLCIALASQSLGIAIAVGAAVDFALQRRRWTDSWVVLAPLALYGVWTAAYQNQSIVFSRLGHAVPFAAKAAAGTLSSLVGLSGMSGANQTGTLLRYGYPLLGLALLAMIWLAVRRRYPPRAVTFTVMLIVFWVLSALHDYIQSPIVSRYLYADCVFAVLLIAELARDWSPPATGTLVVGFITLAICVSNIEVLRSTSATFRLQGTENRAWVTGINLAHDSGARNLPIYAILRLTGKHLLAAEAALGSAGESQQQLMAQAGGVRTITDNVLLVAGQLRARSVHAGRGAQLGGQALLRPEVVSGGRAVSDGACALVVPLSHSLSSAPARFEVTVPRGGMTIAGSPVVLAARRFGPEFIPVPRATHSRAIDIDVRQDVDPASWQLQLSTTGRTLVCPQSG